MKYWTAKISASGNPPAPYGIGEIIDELESSSPYELLQMIDDAHDGIDYRQTHIIIHDQNGDEVSWDFMQRHYT